MAVRRRTPCALPPRWNKVPATAGARHPEKAGDGRLPQVSNFRTLRGLGVSGEAEGHTLLLGNRALLTEHGVDTSALDAELNAQASQGATPVLLARDGQVAALLAVRDPLRGTA